MRHVKDIRRIQSAGIDIMNRRRQTGPSFHDLRKVLCVLLVAHEGDVGAGGARGPVEMVGDKFGEVVSCVGVGVEGLVVSCSEGVADVFDLRSSVLDEVETAWHLGLVDAVVVHCCCQREMK